MEVRGSGRAEALSPHQGEIIHPPVQIDDLLALRSSGRCWAPEGEPSWHIVGLYEERLNGALLRPLPLGGGTRKRRGMINKGVTKSSWCPSPTWPLAQMNSLFSHNGHTGGVKGYGFDLERWKI